MSKQSGADVYRYTMSKQSGAAVHAASTEERLVDLQRWGLVQSDNISHIDMGDDHIDTVISHIISPYPISISRMTILIW
jgi:hypothetical protein